MEEVREYNDDKQEKNVIKEDKVPCICYNTALVYHNNTSSAEWSGGGETRLNERSANQEINNNVSY